MYNDVWSQWLIELDEVDPEMLRIMEAAENSDIGSDFDYEEEEVDESKYEIKDNKDYELTALDQFLIDANKEPDYSFNLGAHIANLLSQIDDDDYGEEDELFVEDNKHSYQQSQDIHEKRDIDKHFDVVWGMNSTVKTIGDSWLFGWPDRWGWWSLWSYWAR